MIQRIQSIYLLLTAILMAVTAFSPLFGFNDGQNNFIFHSYGVGELSSLSFPTWGILTFAVLSSILSLVAVFLYKNRKIQVKLTYVTGLLIIFYYVTAMVYLNAYMTKIPAESALSIQFGIILPVVALIFDLLAASKIKKDEKLVRSLDRIR